jgi:hypothetical protein
MLTFFLVVFLPHASNAFEAIAISRRNYENHRAPGHCEMSFT